MKINIKKVGVIGAGVMGAGIAAQLANVGLDTILLDILPPDLSQDESDKNKRNGFALAGIKKALASKPASFYLKESSSLIRVGNLEDDLELLSDVDWIVEVVLENLSIKKSLFEKLEAVIGPDTIVTSNTSGISAAKMCAERSDNFKQHFAITHFFNPPRYQKLVELVAGPQTDTAVLASLEAVCENILGKGVVVAKDTPNFIANRLGIYAIFAVISAGETHKMSIEDMDGLTGKLIGRAKSASFRTMDLVGLDIVKHAASNVYNEALNDPARNDFKLPLLIEQLIEKKYLGDKTGSGFYQKTKDSSGKRLILSIDKETLNYTAQNKTKFKSMAAANVLPGAADKLQALYFATDTAGRFTFEHISKTLLYCAALLGEIADTINHIDNAMKWGFAWKVGPFEMWDQLGLKKSAQAMIHAEMNLPSWISEMLADGYETFYKTIQGERYFFSPKKGGYEPVHYNPRNYFLPKLKTQQKLVSGNSGASLVDVGDGVACLEFHTKMNAIGDDIMDMVSKSVDIVRTDFDGLIIGNHSAHFSAGANLPVLLFAAQEEEWDDVDWMVQKFQSTLMKLKYLGKPVVAAPAGMALGGGCEICLSANRVRYAAETYIGLVEAGVGLLPAGGGCKEMTIRAIEPLFTVEKGGIYPSQIEQKPFLARAFETIGMAKVSTSGKEAHRLGIFRSTDKMTVNRDFLLYDAKNTVLAMNLEGFGAPDSRATYRVPGLRLASMFHLALYTMNEAGYITDHDQIVAKEIARVLCGGDVQTDTMVTEQYLLDLEREAFLRLLGYPATQARIEHVLKTGKPLRN